MSKIIIHNNSMQDDEEAVLLVSRVMGKGFISGDKQYCWLTTYDIYGVEVHAKPTRGTTHTFEVRDIE